MSDKDKNIHAGDDEELINETGSYVVGGGPRGRAAISGDGDAQDEEEVTDSGSCVVTPGSAPRGRKAVDAGSESKEEKVTESGSYVADLGSENRGMRGARRSERPAPKRTVTDTVQPEYVINGKTYKGISLISASTGEAKIVLVEHKGKRFALKIYHANIGHHPNHDVLEAVMRARGNGVLIDIYEHGVWKNPEIGGEECDYEIMQYCEGGALKAGELAGKPDELRDVTLRMVAAADYCSRLGILHRDIKPENFFWVDKAKTQLVLADFGLAIVCPKGETVVTEYHRTKIYTAPEFYVAPPGKKPMIGCESDFYSVGISMLTLWSGEQVMLGMTERELINRKQYGQLAYPEDLPKSLLQLLRGLTIHLPAYRWNFDTVRRWDSGKLNADDTRMTGIAELNIVFNSKKNLVAHSCSELATLMLKDMTLGKKYLYSGRITKWLEEDGLKDIALYVEEIYDKIHPKDQDAGFWSTIYLLDPGAPSYLPDSDFSLPEEKWHKAEGLEALGEEIYNTLYHNDGRFSAANLRMKLSTALGMVTSPIMCYLLASDRKDDVEQILMRTLGTYGGSEYNSILDLIYTLAPGLPFVIGDSEVEDVDQLLAALPKEGDNLSRTYEVNTDLTSPGFVKWLIERDPVLAGKVAKAASDYGTNYAVVYALSPQMDYLFNSDPNAEGRVFSSKELGLHLNAELCRYLLEDAEPDDDDIVIEELGFDEDEGRVYAYLESKGAYGKLIPWIKSCLEYDQGDNKKKYGPYDAYYGLFKIIKGLGNTPYYIMKEGDEPLTDPSQLSRYSKAEILDAIENRHLDAWVATFYQEDPSANLKPKYAYEKLTAKFTDFMARKAPDWEPAADYKEAIGIVDSSSAKTRFTSIVAGAMKWIFVPVLILGMLFVLLATVVKGIPDYNPVDGHFWVVTLVLGLIGTFIMFAIDDDTDPGCALNMGVGFGGAALVTFGLKYLFSFVSGYLTWIFAGLVVVATVFLVISMLKALSLRSGSTQGVNVVKPDFQHRELEALHFAYRNNTRPFRSTVETFADPFIRDNKGVIRSGFAWALGSIFAVVIAFFCLYFLSPAVGGSHSIGYDAVNPGLKMAKCYLGKVGETDMVLRLDSIEGFRVDSASVKAGSAKLLPLTGQIGAKNGKTYQMQLKATAEDSLKKWYGEYRLDINVKDSSVTGVFIPGRPDKKGEIVPQEINLKAGEAPAEAPEAEKTGKRKKSKSKQ